MTTGITEDRKQALRALREQRGAVLKAAQQSLKEQVSLRKELKQALKDGPLTVPEIFTATGISTSVLFWHLMAMKKYGLVVEVEDDGGYYRYGLGGE